MARNAFLSLIVGITVLVLHGCQTVDPQSSRKPYGDFMRRCRSITSSIAGAGYEELFDVALSTTNTSIRVASVYYLTKGEPVVDNLMFRVLTEPQFTLREKDMAAYILHLRRDPAFQKAVAQYYVGKLRDPKYRFKYPSGFSYSVGEDLSIVKWEKEDGSEVGKLVKYIPARHVLPVVVGIGRIAVPYLLELLSSDDLIVRMNAFVALQRITKLQLPYDAVKKVDEGVAHVLQKNGWLDEVK